MKYEMKRTRASIWASDYLYTWVFCCVWDFVYLFWLMLSDFTKNFFFLKALEIKITDPILNERYFDGSRGIILQFAWQKKTGSRVIHKCFYYYLPWYRWNVINQCKTETTTTDFLVFDDIRDLLNQFRTYVYLHPQVQKCIHMNRRTKGRGGWIKPWSSPPLV